jgi:hypothetical protein
MSPPISTALSMGRSQSDEWILGWYGGAALVFHEGQCINFHITMKDKIYQLQN